MFGREFLNHQKHWLLARKEAKFEMLKEEKEGVRSRYQRDITRIDFALCRLKESQYGLRTHCGIPIEKERLDAVPESPFCALCQNEVEVAKTTRA